MPFIQAMKLRSVIHPGLGSAHSETRSARRRDSAGGPPSMICGCRGISTERRVGRARAGRGFHSGSVIGTFSVTWRRKNARLCFPRKERAKDRDSSNLLFPNENFFWLCSRNRFPCPLRSVLLAKRKQSYDNHTAQRNCHSPSLQNRIKLPRGMK
jgi:hypothetical protein